MTRPDAELLAAFETEFRDGAARLAEASDGAAAARLVANLRAMAEATGLPGLLVPCDAAAAAAEPFDPGALRAAAEAMQVALATAMSPEPTLRVLLVDDSAMMRRLLRESLAPDRCFEVVGEAADGAEALALCAELAPDLVLLDIEMPRMDGVAMLKRWTLEGSGAVVVVSSATPPGSALAREVRRLGAAGVVGKPSGALSPDLAVRRGAALRAAARRAGGLAEAAP